MARQGRKRKPRRIVGGVDTHLDTHHAAVVLMNGGRVADAEFPATAQGYAQMLGWMRSFGRLHAVGVEGTGSYGAGLSRYLRGQDVRVVEVNRPDRRQRRAQGKSDPLDSYAAADAVLAGRARAIPKAADGLVEAIRAIHTTRAGAVKARTAAINQLRAVLITAPDQLREQLSGLTTRKLITTCAALRPTGGITDPAAAAKTALRRLARRYQALTEEITAADTDLRGLVTAVRPDLLARRGVGPETAAQLLITVGDNPERLTSEAGLAALCGASPIPASSGKTNRHRLNPGGDRQANRALHTIALARMATCEKTKTYITKRTAGGKHKKEIIRQLKRYIVRELYKFLTSNNATEDDLRSAA